MSDRVFDNGWQEGYLRREWADRMARRYVQEFCSTCGRWAKWRKPREGDRRDENGYWVAEAILALLTDEAGDD